jgi:hypothetical protein
MSVPDRSPTVPREQSNHRSPVPHPLGERERGTLPGPADRSPPSMAVEAKAARLLVGGSVAIRDVCAGHVLARVNGDPRHLQRQPRRPTLELRLRRGRSLLALPGRGSGAGRACRHRAQGGDRVKMSARVRIVAGQRFSRLREFSAVSRSRVKLSEKPKLPEDPS